MAVSVCPFEIIEQAPGVEGANIRPVSDGARQFCQLFTEEFGAPRVRHTAVFFFVGRVEIAAAAFGDFNDAPVATEWTTAS